MKSGMNAQTGEVLTGIPYLRQRLKDVILTPLGSVVGRRDFGSRLFQMVDHNVDAGFQMDAYIRLAEAINNPANGLDDFRLSEMRMARMAPGHIEISLSGVYLPTGQAIDFDGIELNGRD
ncbi:MAG: baseplate assembly protein W [Shewanella sp.]|nr:baseplate assembly protein W [Shewanella sp.]